MCSFTLWDKKIINTLKLFEFLINSELVSITHDYLQYYLVLSYNPSYLFETQYTSNIFRCFFFPSNSPLIYVSRIAFKILTGTPTGNIPLRRPRLRWEDNIKMDLK